ncbi:F-box only protein 10-like isoform X1 [Anguilla rostrata]|uniref:F-box only protein 10-like isoform X1 n=1 Tax=Anguilla rostrata TaxID=7938 RepID=UPI0030CC9CBC
MEVAGLPVELWRVILAYLPLPDLGRCSLVCRAWRELILSLDKTRWRQLCLGCPECRHPNWPNRPHLEPPSWREALRQQALASRTWTRNGPEPDSAACLYLFRRKKDRRTWRVGPGLEHETLRGALSAAGAYDRVVLHPGVYEEQTEVALKVPVEIVGKGKLGEVALLVSIDQQCPTARLCNLVFMPAWFSPVVYKTSSGHVQLDNCNLEGGQLQVRGPGTCQARYCSFGQASGAHFQGVALSLLESCDFSGSETASVTVEGPPVSDRNWACRHLAALAKSSAAPFAAAAASGAGPAALGAGPAAADSDAARPERADGLPGAPPLGVASTPEDPWRKGGRWCGDGGGAAEDCGEGTVIEDGCSESEPSEEEDEGEGEEEGVDQEEGQEASGPEAYKLSYSRHGLSHLLGPSRDSSSAPPEPCSLQQELQRDREAQALAGSVQGCLLRRCLFRDGKGGVLVCNHGQAWLEGNVFRGLTYAVRCIQNAKIVMLRNEVSGCKGSGVFLRLSAQGLIAENNIHSNAEAGLDIRKGANPIILCNRIHSGLRSGIVVLGNGKGSIRSNQIYGNKEAGIYILYNGNPVVSGNHIFQGQAAGIAVNENGRGLIIENVIRENQWGGVDIRRGGDPILKNNFICHGYSDGVVVGERGRGVIEGNHIYCNRGCGVWVMSSSLPQLSRNSISHNRIYGVAVFCRKDSQGGGRGDGYPSGQGAGGGGGAGGGANENFNEEGELLAWESDLDSEDERFSSRRPVTVALVEGNSISNNGAVGLYVKSSEALNAVGNVLRGNGGAGVALLQSAQLSRLVANCICGNGRAGVTVAAGCRAELRGNGIYDNRGPGVSSRGDGQIVENDVVGNRGCGLRLRESADIKVLRNRVQSARGCGIVVLEQVKGVVQENLVFQGWAGCTKPLLHRDPGNNTCVLLNNTLLARGRKSNRQTDPPWALENPPPRPQPEGQPTSAPSGPPAQRSIAIATRITARVESGCHNNGSIFCTIL